MNTRRPGSSGDRPDDAAARAFEEIRRTHREGPRPPGWGSAATLGLIVVIGIGLVGFALNANRRVAEPDFIFDLSDGEVRRLDEPPDLGPAPELGVVLDWSHDPSPPEYPGRVTAIWFNHDADCSTCWQNSRYWESLVPRHRRAGLTVVSVVQIDRDRLDPDDVIWRAAADPDGSVGRMFVPEGPGEDHVVVVDASGRIRLSVAGKPLYDTVEPVIAKLLLALGEE
jgi:hypothetical protein